MLVSAVPGFGVHVPGHPDEVPSVLRSAVRALRSGRSAYIRLSTEANRSARAVSGSGRLQVLREGSLGVVIAAGPLLDPVLDAVSDLDVGVAYATTVRPFDADGLRAVASASGVVVLVEPYLAGTSSAAVSSALSGRPHRVLGLGVRDPELRRYRTPGDHARMQGLDATGIRRSVTEFLGLT